jgi:hypothetical protein
MKINIVHSFQCGSCNQLIKGSIRNVLDIVIYPMRVERAIM